MPKPGVTGLRRILNASVYSWQGLRATWQHEAAFRQELLLVAVLTPLAFFEATNLSQLLLMLLSLAVVLIAELLNSAIESVVDRISELPHELAGRAKDQGSAAVFIALALVIIVWGAIIAHNHVL